MSEGSSFFRGESDVQKSLRKITRRLDELKIPYALVGGMALFYHGYRRFTEDIDILVDQDGLREIDSKLIGKGYRHPFPGARNLRDTETRVNIEFLVAGQFPGDGRPKPVVFPPPEEVAEQVDGIRLINLGALVELKLASGISDAGRLKDLSDVQELIKTLRLQRDLGERLNPYVQAKFYELWDSVQSSRNVDEP